MGDEHRPDSVAAGIIPASLAGVAHRQCLRHPAGEPDYRAARFTGRGIADRSAAVAGAYCAGLDDDPAAMVEYPARSRLDTTCPAAMEHRVRHAGRGVDAVALRLSGTLAGIAADAADVSERARAATA